MSLPKHQVTASSMRLNKERRKFLWCRHRHLVLSIIRMIGGTRVPYIGGWDCESNREIVFVSFVRACLRASGCFFLG